MRLIQEDFLKAKILPIDLIVTDPPYRWNKTTGGRAKNDPFAAKWQGKITGKDVVRASLKHNSIKFTDWMQKAYDVLKNPGHCYIFVNDKNVQDALNAATAVGFRLHNILTWKKNNCTPNNWYMKNSEFILFLYKGKAFPINNRNTKQILEYKNISGKLKLHPTQKPVPLLKELILNSSRKNDVVFDPFMGSGSTGEAALACGREFIGCEIDPQYFVIAQQRLCNRTGESG